MPTTSNPSSKSRRPAFKPPRPSSTNPHGSKPKAKPKPTPKGKEQARRKSAPAKTNTFPSSNDDDELRSVHLSDSASSLAFDDTFVDDGEHPDMFDPIEPPRDRSTQSDPPPTIPPALLTRLLHHHLNSSSSISSTTSPSVTKAAGEIKIGKSATPVLGKYFEIFVQEAIARAESERRNGEKEGDGEKGDGFLEVEHLEKLVPQLVMDF